MSDIRHLDDLVMESGSKKRARELIREAAACTYGDYYDHSAVQSLRSEPQTSNLGRAKKDQWTLSPGEGVGAIKHLLDGAGLDLVRHVYNGQNSITVRNAGGRRRHAKVYTTSRMTVRSPQRARFTLTGYQHAEAPRYYLLLSFDGPIAWVIKRRDLLKQHEEIKAKGFVDDGVGGYSIPRSCWDHKNGRMVLYLGVETHGKLLLNSRRFDL